jgi:hypothetical protein
VIKSYHAGNGKLLINVIVLLCAVLAKIQNIKNNFLQDLVKSITNCPKYQQRKKRVPSESKLNIMNIL